MKKILVLLICLTTPAVAHALELNFSVTERAGVARDQSHINYSIPIAKEENLLSESSFGIINKEAEFKVLARYGGTPSDNTKPIKMVLVDFQDDFGANQTKQYTFTTSAQNASQPNNLAAETSNFIEVDTGAAVFRISKDKGNLFDYVAVDGKVLVDKPTNSGMTVKVNGTNYSSYNSQPDVQIFRNGPMSAVVVVSGQLKDISGNPLAPPTPSLDNIAPDSTVRYSFYYTFHKGKSYAKVEQTLKNNGRGWSRFNYRSVEHLYIDSWKSTLEYTSAGTGKKAVFLDFTEQYANNEYRLKQIDENDHGFEVNSYAFKAELKRDGNKVKSWGKYNSYAAIEDSNGGIMLGDKWFWQNHPSEYYVKNNELTYFFLPEREENYRGFSPPSGYSVKDIPERYLDTGKQYRVLGGMWKTNRTIYYFHGGSGKYAQALADLQHPLIITLAPDYVGNTKFFSFLFPPNFTSDHTFAAGEKLQDSISRWRNYARSIWDPDFDHSYGKSFPTLREMRSVPMWSWTKDSDGSTAKTYPSWYGWLRFGGSPRSLNFGFNSQHYDFSYQAYLVYQRDNYFPAYQLYEEMVEHLTDVLTLHDPEGYKTTSPTDDKYLHGSQRYEQDALADNYQDRTFNINDPHYGNAHVWTRGVFVYYLLTGNPRYAEIMDQYLYHVDTSKSLGAASGETRDLTRLIGPAINYWEVYGDPKALESAWDIWLRLEASGSMVGNDMFALDCRISSNKLWIGYDAMGIQYILRLYYALKEARMKAEATHLLTKIKQIGKWNKDMVMGAWQNPPGTYSNTNTYHKYTTTNALYLNSNAQGNFSSTLPYSWDSKFYNANYSLSYSDLYAFMYRETTDDTWLEMARTAFKDRFMYNLAGPDQTEDPQDPYLQPYGVSGAVSSGSWKFGMAITKPLLYLQTEQAISTGWKPELKPEIDDIRVMPKKPE